MDEMAKALDLLQRLKHAFIDNVTDPYPEEVELLREIDEFTALNHKEP